MVVAAARRLPVSAAGPYELARRAEGGAGGAQPPAPAAGGVVPLSVLFAVNLALGSDFSVLIGLLLLAYTAALLVPVKGFFSGLHGVFKWHR